jgi:hypothetical protein
MASDIKTFFATKMNFCGKIAAASFNQRKSFYPKSMFSENFIQIGVLSKSNSESYTKKI